MDCYESVLLVKNNINIYKISPLSGDLKYRANDWNLEKPDWIGRLKLVSIGDNCIIKFEDAQGNLFAKCPIDKYPSKCLEGVSDSSRYFVVRLLSDDGRSAFVGLGFNDRSDSFDLNVTLQDHFRWIKESEKIENKIIDTNNKIVDLKLKEGETIKINFSAHKTKESPKNKIKTACLVKLPTPESSTYESTPNFITSNSTHKSINSSNWETFN